MKTDYIHRSIEPVLRKVVDQFPCAALTGPRQSGKSTLLKNVYPEYTYVSFDDPLHREQAISDPNLFLDEMGEKVVLDEIQYVPELLSYIKVRIDEKRSLKGQYILTGSQQFSLIKNIGDSLAGRVGILELLPFTIFEIEKVSGMKTVTKDPLALFCHVCLRGGFPELNIQKGMDAHQWYGAYLQTYLERDIRTVYNIGSLRDFRNFIQMLAARCSQELNLSALSKQLGVSVNTLKSWISVLEACRIIYLLMPYYNNFGKRIVKAPKVYFTDSGLVTYLVGIQTKDSLLKGPMAGALFENYCVQELIKAALNRGHRPRMHYLRTHNGLEVDLILEREVGTVIPAECKMTKTPKISMASNIDRFRSVFDKLNVQDGRLLTLVSSDRFIKRDVKAVHLKEFISECIDMNF